MNYEFYADVFFLSNFYMDFLTVYAVNEILEGRKRAKRFLVISGIGSLAGLFLILAVGNYSLYLLLVHFLLNPIMILFCFAPAKKETLLKAWFLMYLISLLLGGSVEWMYQTLMDGKYYEACLLLSAVPVAAFLFILRRRRKSVHLFYDATIQNKGKSVFLRAYFDTGNMLRDPYVGMPVHVIGEKAAMALFGEEGLKPRLIPYSSIGNPDGMIKAVTVEKLLVSENGKETVVAPCVIALAADQLFSGKNYDMILNCALEEKLEATQIIENERRNEEKRCT